MSALDRPAPAPVVVDPTTAEVIDLAQAPTDTIAAYLANVRDLERQIREQKKLAAEEVIRRMDEQAVWTVRVGDWKLSAPSPAPATVYDAAGLLADLEQLQADDLVAPAAVQRAVERIETLRVVPAGVKALEKLGGAVADAIERHRSEQPKDRRVSVSVRTDL